MEMVAKALLGDIDVKYLGVMNASLELLMKSNGKITSFTTRKNDFIMRDIAIINDPAIPLTIGSLYMGLKDYRAYDADSNYAVSFDSIILLNRKLELSIFVISPTAKNRSATDRKDIRMRSLNVEGVNWLELAFNKKLVARNVTLVNPRIDFITPAKKPAAGARSKSMLDVFHGLTDKISFDKLHVQDAYVNLQTGNKTHITLDRVNADLAFNHFLNARNFNELTNSLEDIRFSTGRAVIGNNTVFMENGLLNRKDKTLTAHRASLTNTKGRISGEMEDIVVKNIRQDDSHHLSLGSLAWNRAALSFHAGDKKKDAPKPGSGDKGLVLDLGRLDGKNTSVSLQSAKMISDIQLDNMHTESITWDGRGRPVISGLDVTGRSMLVENDAIHLRAHPFEIHDGGPSQLRNFSFTSIGKKDTFSLSCANIAFTPDIRSTLSGRPTLNDVVLRQPVVRLLPTGDTAKKTGSAKSGKLPSLQVNSLSIIDPVISRLTSEAGKKLDVSEQKSSWVFSDICIDSNHASIGKINSDVTGISAGLKKINLSVKGEGKLNLDLSDISYSPGENNKPAEWSAILRKFSAGNVEMQTKKNDTVTSTIMISSIQAMDLGLNSGEKLEIRDMLAKIKTFRIANGNFSIQNAKSNILLHGLAYDHVQGRLKFDSFALHPAVDRETFMKSKTWQTDYLELKTGETILTGIDPERFFNDSIFFAQKIQVFDPVLHVYKDKRLPFDSSQYKALPAAMIQKVGLKFRMDSLQLKDGDITYEEFNDKTLKTGEVHLRRTQALMENISNFHLSATDSLRLSATTWFMDTAYLRLKFTESYLDTLHGFALGVRVRPFDLTALNPMLGPLVSAKINSGFLDTLRMNAIGREYLAFGKMKMYYHGLKAQYLEKGNEKVKTLKTRIITFAANDLVLRHNNKRGYGKVYAERVRARSVFNYWLKMLTSGVMSSTGVKSNRKQDKKYNRSLRRLKVPEIPEVDL